MQLGECARDDQVLAGVRQGEPVVKGGIIGKLGVGFVQHQHDLRRQAVMQGAQLGACQEGPRRIAGLGDEDQPGALVHRFQHRRDGQPVAGLGRFAHLRLAGPGADGVGGKATLPHDDVVARLQEHLVQEVEHLVGAVAEHQALGLQVEVRRHRRPEACRPAVGIEVHPVSGGEEGVPGLGAGPQDVLVGRQLDRVLEADRQRLAGFVGDDVQDAGLGFGPDARALTRV